MRRKSHKAMGRCLSGRYFPDSSRWDRKLFLLGCVEPDRNPVTYCKGSLRCRWMRGHDYENALRFMLRLTARMEKKSRFSPWDYYSLGKLIHYTLDAFTYPHNDHFPEGLAAHREYEVLLQTYFLQVLRDYEITEIFPALSPAEILKQEHMHYMQQPGGIATDTAYAIRVSCRLVQMLIPERHCVS